MTNTDPFEKIEYFREAKRAKAAAETAVAEAWSHNNESIVSAGERIVSQGLDQWQLLERMWETTRAHVTLLKLAGIQYTGKREDRSDRINDTFDVSSKSITLPGGLFAVVKLETKGRMRGDRFHRVAEEVGIHEAIEQFVAPDVCALRIYERNDNSIVTSNWLDPGDFVSPDTNFADRWIRSCSPFRRFTEYDCKAEKGRFQPSSSLDLHPMTHDQLVYGAGLWAIHTDWINEIGEYIPKR